MPGAVNAAVPSNVMIDIDFTSFLLDFETALPVSLELEKFPNVAIFESPISQGNASLPGKSGGRSPTTSARHRSRPRCGRACATA